MRVSQERRGQWLRGVLEVCLLGALDERESYGYELAQSLESAGLGPIRGGTLYPALLRLQRTGLVTTHWRDGDAGPARKYYRLTDSGRQTLRETAAEWETFAGSVRAILREVPAP